MAILVFLLKQLLLIIVKIILRHLNYEHKNLYKYEKITLILLIKYKKIITN